MPHTVNKPRLLVISEGNAESWDSWSGTSKSVVNGLRHRGHHVITGDSDIYGLLRPLIGGTQYSMNRKRWWVKYHLGRLPFFMRSRNAAALVQRYASECDAILQFGATFNPGFTSGLPLFLYCDGNIALSSHARPSGQSEASHLRESEIESVRTREYDLYRRASHIFTISERLRQSFVEDFSIPLNNVTTVYAGANIPTLDSDMVYNGEYPWPPTVLFVGRQFERKGGDVLLRAFQAVKTSIPDARLLLLGPEGLEISQEGVVQLGLIDKDAPDGTRRIADVYRQSHVFCMPTRYEGLSISFLEAMSFGLPCVSTYTEWSQPEMILDGETGLVIPMDDDEALAAALVELLSHPQKAKDMGERGRARASSIFTWDRVTALMSEEITRKCR